MYILTVDGIPICNFSKFESAMDSLRKRDDKEYKEDAINYKTGYAFGVLRHSKGKLVRFVVCSFIGAPFDGPVTLPL